jgi:hypothetical protein
VFGFFEIGPQLILESRANLPTRVIGLAQLHLLY